MFDKKYLIISLLFMIIAIGAISQVSAADLSVDEEMIAGDASIDEVSASEMTVANAPIEEANADEIIGADASMEGVSAEEIAGDKAVGSDSTSDEVVSQDSNTEVAADTETTTTGTSVKSTQPTKVKIKAAKLTTIYKSTKKFKVKVLDSNNKAVSGVKLKIKVYTGSKYKTFKATTNSKGIATIKVSALKLGKHKVRIVTNSALYTGSASSSIKIKPRPVAIKTVTFKEKELSIVCAAVKDKTLKKYVNGIPVKVLIYTGKKYKTFKTKTSYVKELKTKGSLMYMTNAFTAGKHKVKIIAYGNYKGTKTTKITILKSAKKTVPMYAITKKGKLVVYVKYKNQWLKA